MMVENLNEITVQKLQKGMFYGQNYYTYFFFFLMNHCVNRDRKDERLRTILNPSSYGFIIHYWIFICNC